MKLQLKRSNQLPKRVNGFALRICIWWLHGFPCLKRSSRCWLQTRNSDCGWLQKLTPNSLQFCFNLRLRLPTKRHLACEITSRELLVMSLPRSNRASQQIVCSYCLSSRGSIRWFRSVVPTFPKAGSNTTNSRTVIWKRANPSYPTCWKRAVKMGSAPFLGKKSMESWRMQSMEGASIIPTTCAFSEPTCSKCSQVRLSKGKKHYQIR